VSTVKSAAPKAEEKISHSMPYYSHHGRLAYFAAFKNHVSFYVMGQAREQYAKELKPYATSKATLRFPIGTRIPVTLLRRLIRARVRENEAKER
jgi:uncharacterized protein YdhG (YjbR/CyaY superfamily)